MWIAAVAVALMLGSAPDDEAASLVARLGSARFADREAAAESLRRLGRRALPALREARSERDPEIRLRASKLHSEIESVSLLEPTRIRLDFRDRPLNEVIDEVGRRAAVSLVRSNETPTGRGRQAPSPWPDRRITLEAPDPLPFWEAIDGLCRAGGLRRLYPQHPFGPDEAFDRLVLRPGMATPPRSDAGPFRVELRRVCRERNLDLEPALSRPGRGFGFGATPHRDGDEGVRTSNFFAELVVSVEPRLRIVGDVSLGRLKVTDDRGRSLLREPTAQERRARDQMLRMNPQQDPALHPELRFGSGSNRSSPTRFATIPLDDSIPTAIRTARIEGAMAVAVMGRRGDPIVVPLAGVHERTIEGDGVRLTVHDAGVKPGQFNGEVEFTFETDRAPRMLRVQGPGIGPMEINRPLDLLEREVEILDERGRPLRWNFLKPPPDGLRGRMRLLIHSDDPRGPMDFSGVRLRVSTMVGAAMEFPFAFADVPLP